MIDTAYFRTKYFAIAAAVALAIVGAAAGAFALGGRAIGDAEHACDAPAVAGRALTATREVTPAEEGERRTVRYTLDAGALDAGSLDLCISVGEVLVEPSAGAQVELVFTITSRHAAAVEGTVVDAAFADDAGRLRIGAWEAQRGEATATFFGEDSAIVRLVVRVPDSGAYDVRAQNDVGDVRVNGVRAASLDLRTGVGDVHAIGVGLEGNATATSEVGDVILSFGSVQTGAIVASSDVGSAEVELPRRADVGYDAVGETDVGAVELRLGDVEHSASAGDGPGEREEQRTTGFATKPTRVTVRATAEVGDVRILAAESPQ